MKREFLAGLGVEGLTKEIIQQIMDEHGKTVNANKIASEESINQLKAQLEQKADITPDSLIQLKEELTQAKEALSKFDGVDVDTLTADLAAAQTKITEMEQSHSEKITELEANAILREKIAGITFTSDYARKGVFEDIKAKVKYVDGNLEGWDEAIKEIKEAQPNAFYVKEDEGEGGDEGGNHRRQSDSSTSKDIPLII